MKNSKLTSSEEKGILVEILKYIDDVCQENDIHYSLGGGTLLGSIRHHGFIPWDDDADIMLIRSEYNKLIEVLAKDKQYKLLVNQYGDQAQVDLPYAYAKLVDTRTYVRSLDLLSRGMGVYVDIFPIDGVPDDKKQRDAYTSQMLIDLKAAQESNIKYYWDSNSNWKIISKIILRLPQYIKNRSHASMTARYIKLNEDMQKYPSEKVRYSTWLGTMYNELYESKLFETYKRVKFENVELSAIDDSDTYLKNLYGDYMQLPPKNKRIHHSFYTFMWRDK